MDINDHFTRKSGSTVWPSSDRSESPFDVFTCKHCTALFQWQAYGVHRINGPSFEDDIKANMKQHLKYCPEFYKKLKSGEIQETLDFHL
jgi:hypothetical protein